VRGRRASRPAGRGGPGGLLPTGRGRLLPGDGERTIKRLGRNSDKRSERHAATGVQGAMQSVEGSPPFHEASCPFCERTVLVYEDPPRCPFCACPLEEYRVD